MLHALDYSQENGLLEKYNLSMLEIDNIANQALNTFHVPGMALGIIADNQILLSKGYGFRDPLRHLSVDENTLFPIASCTKAFTAFLICQLVDEQKIDFDDQVIKYLPELHLWSEELTTNLTIRDLLAHRSGIARHDPIWVYLEPSRSKVLEILRGVEPIFELRKEFHYNNFMYSVLGLIIEKITGQSWEEAVTSRILRPLEMLNSNTSLEQLRLSFNFSYPHARINDETQRISFANLISVNPGGGINSNIIEMLNWLRIQLSKEHIKNFISEETLQECRKMQMPFSTFDKKEEIYQLGYGLGWFIGKYRNTDWISHGGDIDGFSSDVSLFPEKGIGLVILTNSSTHGRHVIFSVRNQIVDKILNEGSTDWLTKQITLNDKTLKTIKDSLDSFEKNKEIQNGHISYHEYVGFYEHPSYGRFEIRLENGKLTAYYGSMITPLYFKSENLFVGFSTRLRGYGINPIIDFTFFRDREGIINEIEVPFESFRSAKPIYFKKKS